jgi:molecular chaperone DnaK
VSLIEEYVEKTIRLFSEVLKNQNLTSKDITQLILVGGPTQIPYVRTRLKDEFNIPTDYKIDPITVVAQGAAVFAASQLIPDEFTKRDYSKVFVKLAYNPMTTEVDSSVGGRFFPAKNGEDLPDGMRVQISSTSGDWESGMVEVKEAAFFTTVILREHKVNTFKLALFDRAGKQIIVDPDSFSITQGISVAEPPLIRSIGVELEGNAFSKHLNKGESLPARSKPITYYTTRTVRPGEDADVLNIHVWEGESEKSDRNCFIGTLEIKGSQIKRTIPENSEIEIILSIDQSRMVSAEAFCPVADQKFNKMFEQIKLSPKIEPIHIEKDLQGEEKRLKKIEAEIQQIEDKEVKNQLQEARIKEEIGEIKGDIAAAKGGDPDAGEKADRRLKEFRQKLDSFEYLANWPVTSKEYTTVVADCDEIANSYGGDDDKEQIAALKAEGEKAVSSKDAKRLRKVIDELMSIRWAILFRQPGFWVGAFQEIKKNPKGFRNQTRAEELLEEGGMALQRQDLDSLKSIMIELWSLMPSEEQEKIGEKVSDAGIRKL